MSDFFKYFGIFSLIGLLLYGMFGSFDVEPEEKIKWSEFFDSEFMDAFVQTWDIMMFPALVMIALFTSFYIVRIMAKIL